MKQVELVCLPPDNPGVLSLAARGIISAMELPAYGVGHRLTDASLSDWLSGSCSCDANTAHLGVVLTSAPAATCTIEDSAMLKSTNNALTLHRQCMQDNTARVFYRQLVQGQHHDGTGSVLWTVRTQASRFAQQATGRPMMITHLYGHN